MTQRPTKHNLKPTLPGNRENGQGETQTSSVKSLVNAQPVIASGASAPKPKRIKLSRAAGWRMPPNTVSVARPSVFGNPFVVGVDGDAAECVRKFRKHVTSGKSHRLPYAKGHRFGWQTYLRGKDVGCWCELSEICHGDVLLELANEPIT